MISVVGVGVTSSSLPVVGVGVISCPIVGVGVGRHVVGVGIIPDVGVGLTWHFGNCNSSHSGSQSVGIGSGIHVQLHSLVAYTFLFVP